MTNIDQLRYNYEDFLNKLKNWDIQRRTRG